METLSSPYEKPAIRLRPRAIDAKSSARWPMLLSEGTGTLPMSGFLAGWTRRSVKLRGW